MIQFLVPAALATIFIAPKIIRGKPPGLAYSERHIKQLDKSIQLAARRLIWKAWHAGIPIVVASGYRSIGEQNALYAQGRTASGPIVTNAKGGSSWHNHRLAFDVAIWKNGKPTWPENGPWTKIGKLGKSIGLSWGGDWPKPHGPDRPHFDYHPGLNIRQAMAGQRPKPISLIKLV